jgi:hypothetical protein
MSSRMGKFHLEPLISHFMFRHTPKYYFCNYRVTNQRIWQSQSAQLHIVRNNGDFRSKDLAGVPLETN